MKQKKTKRYRKAIVWAVLFWVALSGLFWWYSSWLPEWQKTFLEPDQERFIVGSWSAYFQEFIPDRMVPIPGSRVIFFPDGRCEFNNCHWLGRPAFLSRWNIHSDHFDSDWEIEVNTNKWERRLYFGHRTGTFRLSTFWSQDMDGDFYIGIPSMLDKRPVYLYRDDCKVPVASKKHFP
ncbi:MAG: hypothetical protein IJ678_06700 [Kiritimatiellae bacterium]|nr:hypothetical protein [Kiritimatiellia bacterium]